MTKAEKEAAKAAKQAEEEAAKAATDSVEAKSAKVEAKPSIDSEGVFVNRYQPGSKAEAMLFHLASLPTMRFIVPLEGDEKPGKNIYQCILNGLVINILKGVPVTLPEQVVKHLENSFQLTMKAEKENDSLLSNTGGLGKFLGKA